MTERDLLPLMDSAEPDTELLRLALKGARADTASPERLASILAATAGAGVVAGAGAAQASTLATTGVLGAATSKLTAVLVVAGLGSAGAGAWWMTRPDAPSHPVAVSQSSAVVVNEAPAAARVDSEPSVAAPVVSRERAPRAVRPTAAEPPVSEMSLLREAQTSVASNPSRALELLALHQQKFPASALAQEREFLRIQALLGSGKRAQAQASARAFRTRFAGSAYGPRLDQLLGSPPDAGF